MRFAQNSVCTPQLLAVVYDMRAQNFAPRTIAEELHRQFSVKVSRASVYNWLAGKVPAALKPLVPPSIAASNDVPCGTTQPLEWINVPAIVIRRSSCGFYQILRTAGRHGERFLAEYLEGNPLRTQRLFAARHSLAEALADAEHHHQTGEARP